MLSLKKLVNNESLFVKFPVVIFSLTEMQKWNTETKEYHSVWSMFKSKLFLYTNSQDYL